MMIRARTEVNARNTAASGMYEYVTAVDEVMEDLLLERKEEELHKKKGK